ncbi:hypothetical protein LAZ67_23000266 [Cordylochernes scorpioides]|uniref:Mos1 transposase HTH domain-containing protein n=1 Tax=Cordylochernes scorpioides TaxID=51811 RepID=A0ABY6LQV6_9ARAC|nr:hypothetical protein LAZ67_23000266 [Cordylochernes scorpioides]
MVLSLHVPQEQLLAISVSVNYMNIGTKRLELQEHSNTVNTFVIFGLVAAFCLTLPQLQTQQLQHSEGKQEQNRRQKLVEPSRIFQQVHRRRRATETYELIKEAFSDVALSRSRTFEWFSRFLKGREKVNDDQHTGRPRSLSCEENKLKIKELIKSNRIISIKDLSSETGLSVGLCHQIVTKDLDMIRTFSKCVPRILKEEQKEDHHEFLPFGRTINQEVYLGIMRRLREAVRLKRPERWQNKDWIIHVDNARPHTAHVVLQFLAKHSTIQIPHPPYSPDIAPNDFFLYPKLNMKLKGRKFDNVDMIQAESKATLRNLSKSDFISCFDNWKKRWNSKIYTSSENGENSVQVPKFDGKNFASWKFRIVSILEGKELDDLLEGDPPEYEVKFKEWKKKDAQAKGIITCAMTDSLVALILNCKTSKDIWIALHERYEGDKKKRIIEARNDVSRLTMKKEENWEEYLYRAEKLLEQERNLGADIEDQEFTTTEEREVHKTIKLADDSEIISNAEGAIEIEGQNKLIRLNDVLYVEKLSDNLMSVNKLVDDNKKYFLIRMEDI